MTNEQFDKLIKLARDVQQELQHIHHMMAQILAQAKENAR